MVSISLLTSTTVIGMLLITLGLFSCLYLLKIFGEEIVPILGGLTFAEASVECDLMESNSDGPMLAALMIVWITIFLTSLLA